MRIMSEKEYLEVLDEEFYINGITFQTARFPKGWSLVVISEPQCQLELDWGFPTKASAIKYAEEYAKGTYDIRKVKFL
jgi:hypothetical protein